MNERHQDPAVRERVAHLGQLCEAACIFTAAFATEETRALHDSWQAQARKFSRQAFAEVQPCTH
jgi:hypothetical protein